MKQFNITAYISKCMAVLLTLIILWIAKTCLAPFFLSLLLSVLLAFLAEPLIRPMCRKGIKRSHAAMAVVPLLFLLAAIFFAAAGLLLRNQLEGLLAESSGTVKELSGLLVRTQTKLNDTMLGKLSLWQYLERWLENLDLSPIMKRLSAAAAAMPGFLLGAVFVLLGTYQLAAHRTEIFPFLGRQLSPRLAAVVLQLKDFLLHTVLAWFKAQLILFSVIFLLLCTGLWLANISGWLLIALVTALLDALPLIGAGLILLPWALISVLMGNTTLALELAAIYAIMETVRNLLEPRILSAQLGLPPFVTLCSLYLGFILMGVGGMLLFPLAALTLIKLQEWGYLTIWK